MESAERTLGISSELFSRIVTGALLIGVFAGALALGQSGLIIVALFVTAAIVFEFLSVALPQYRCSKSSFAENDALLYTAAFILIPLGYIAGGLTSLAALSIVLAIAVLIRELRYFEVSEHEEMGKEVIAALAIAAFYPLLLGTALVGAVIALSEAFPLHLWRVVAWFVALVILNDTGAYFVGRTLGKTKLSPRVSPNKTIEGSFGGCALALVLSVPLALLLDLPLSNAVVVGMAFLISILSQFGDLVESFIKRIYGIKDMGDTLPGHGGVFDRVDSYLFAAPALFLLAELV